MVRNAGQKDCAQMWFGPDFRGSLKVQAMSWAEQGMYRHLLDLAWENHGIPSDLEEVRGILRLSPEEFAPAWKRIGKCFVPNQSDPSRLLNERQEKERLIREEIREKRSQSGRKGNDARWGCESQGDRTTIANGVAKDRPSPPPSPSPSPVLPSPAAPVQGTTRPSVPAEHQQDDASPVEDAAGPSRKAALKKALAASTYRRDARDRAQALDDAVDCLDAACIDADDLMALAKLAVRRRGVRKPQSMFAHWIDHPDEAVKELGKRR